MSSAPQEPGPSRKQDSSLRMFALILEHPGGFALAAVAGLLTGTSGWAISYFLKTVLDRVQDPDVVMTMAFAVAAVTVMRTVVGVLRHRLQIAIVRKIEGRTVKRYLAHTLRIEMIRYGEYSPAELDHRMGNLDHLRIALEDRILGCIFDVVTLLAATVLLAIQNPVLSGLGFLGALIPAIVVSQVRTAIKKSYERTQQLNANLHSASIDAFSGVEDLRAAAAEGWMEDRIWQHYLATQDARRSHLLKLAIIGGSTGLVSSLLNILILVIGARGVREGGMTLGDLMFVFTMAGSLMGPLENLVISWIFFDGAAVALDRAEEILRIPAEPKSDALDGPEIKGEFRLEEVTFGYRRNQPVLENLSLTIPAMHSCAIVGESGAGKSTLLGLLAGFYQPWSGRILLDGRDLQDWPRDCVRKAIGAVFQKPHLFEATIEENLGLGSPGIREEELWRALKTAGAEQVVRNLPEGLRYRVPRGGSTLSGGQVQRIALARALARRPKILLLDEATSNLDVHTEAAIWAALEQGSGDRTTVFVTHRLSSSALAGRIVVLDRGRISEYGTYDELMSAKGHYRDLWSRHTTANRKASETSLDTAVA
jgi:ABC-type bacteriocin/lantibiotic exporter with double-glycine peptidase domain